jgi:uncharacterized protein (DUF2141 family)
MTRFAFSAAAAAFALAVPAATAQAAYGPDSAACVAGSRRPAVLVNVTGLKAKQGSVRVQIYNSQNFMVKGQRVTRVDVPVVATTMPICVALPAPGTYAIGVRHDVNGNNKSRDWSDGGGFSRNPKVSLLHLKPTFSEVAVPIGNAPRAVTVILNYRNGLSIGPVGRG